MSAMDDAAAVEVRAYRHGRRRREVCGRQLEIGLTAAVLVATVTVLQVCKVNRSASVHDAPIVMSTRILASSQGSSQLDWPGGGVAGGDHNAADSAEQESPKLLAQAGLSGKEKSEGDVLKAARDITQVLEKGKADESRVRSVEAMSQTHGGKDSGSAALFKTLHEQASAKRSKSKKAVSLAASVGQALDVKMAKGKKQVEMAREEALAIAHVLSQSKQDLAVGSLIDKRSKSVSGTKDWNSFWGSKHSLVTRLAAQVGLSKARVVAKNGDVKRAGLISKAAVRKTSPAKKAPAAIRDMWALLKAAKQ